MGTCLNLCVDSELSLLEDKSSESPQLRLSHQSRKIQGLNMYKHSQEEIQPQSQDHPLPSLRANGHQANSHLIQSSIKIQPPSSSQSIQGFAPTLIYPSSHVQQPQHLNLPASSGIPLISPPSFKTAAAHPQIHPFVPSAMSNPSVQRFHSINHNLQESSNKP